jgi:hypothetical protein
VTNNHGAATNVRSGDQRHAIHTPTGLDWFLARDCLDNRFGDDWLTARRRFRIGAASLEFGEIQDAASRRSARVCRVGRL